MMIFWLAGAAMLAAALAFVIPPLLGTTRGRGPSRQQANVSVYQERRRELELLEESGGLDHAQAALARDELDREMLLQADDSQPALQDAEHSHTTAHPILAIIVAVSLPLLAIGMYLQVGTPSSLLDQQTAEAKAGGTTNRSTDPEQPSVEQMVGRLEQRLRDKPDDVRGWLMLGRSYSVMQRPEDARTALARAYELAPNEPQVMVGYAEVLTTLNNGSLDGEPIELVKRALTLEPDNPRANWLAGIHALNTGNPAQALGAWQKVIDSAALDANVRTQVLKAMDSIKSSAANAQSKNGQQGSTTTDPQRADSAGKDALPTTGPAPELGAASVRISVSLSAALQNQVTGTETVFVFARASNGPPMPLAVQRLTVHQLPTTVVLDDSNSMTPQLALSRFDNVVITARISRSGEPRAAPGDLQGMSAEISTRGSDTLNVVIDQTVE